MKGVNMECCGNCYWADHFEPRQDEIEKGLLLGCRYPGWEGYTKKEDRCIHYDRDRKMEVPNEVV